MRIIISFFIFLLACPCLAQKSIRKSLDNPRTSWVHIDTEHCFELVLSNSATREVHVEAKIDGEYSDELLIAMEEAGNTLTIRPGFRPEFRHPNDKLSAHKVVSISLVVQVPEYTNIKVFGRQSHVQVSGIFSQSEIALAGGICTMQVEAETLKAQTQSGDIYFKSKGARVHAESRYGKVTGGPIQTGNGSVELRTSSGNIFLKQGE